MKFRFDGSPELLTLLMGGARRSGPVYTVPKRGNPKCSKRTTCGSEEDPELARWWQHSAIPSWMISSTGLIGRISAC